MKRRTYRVALLAVVIGMAIMTHPRDARACDFRYVVCDQLEVGCPDINACYTWCLYNTGVPACVDRVSCHVVTGDNVCKCWTCTG